ncbi:hypothetical protein [Flavobacterium psychrophilum]|uniref:hypothetical protein n=1 Tax=Flavobacterium psychrophilum TaxID=96345 RepID=UPI00106DBD77|nr:hypothetical protein [Flavobacterium psychrophilum]
MLKNTKLSTMMASMMALVGISKPPIVEGKVEFDEEASNKLKEALSAEIFEKAIKAFNQDLAESNQAEDIKSSVEGILKELEIPQANLEDIIAKAKSSGGADALSMIKAVQSSLTEYKANQEKIIKRLENSAEDDTPVDTVTKQKIKEAMKHNATHLFASGKDYDAIDISRPWNKAAAEGLTVSATDFSSDVVINKLNSETELYFRENPTEIQSLHRDNFMLPDFWPKRLSVSDRIASGTILTAEITQGRKFGWLPKNIQEIEAEEGKIYPVQIDAEWEGAQLQEIETSWLNMMNKEGSQPEKMSFVRFLVGELMKRARVEDRISSLNGIFVQTPKNATVAGRFINRQNGLFQQLWKARDIDKKFRAFSKGEITPANVYDYFHSDDEADLGMLKRLPQEVLASTNLVFYIHYKVWTWYKAKYKELNGTNMDYKGMPEHFEDYPNIRVQTFVDQENPSFVFATFTDNIEILENVPAEKSSYRFQTLLRKIYLLADYKLGIRIIHIGRQMKEGDPAEFKVQSVWSNDVPIFLEDKFIPVYDKATGIVAVDYRNIQVTEDWKTNITEFTGLKAGQVIKVRGNESMPVSKKVVNGDKIKLTGGADFSLGSGGMLTLLVKSDLTVSELKRTDTVPSSPSTDVLFVSNSIDANTGSIFKYAGSANATIADIDKGVNLKSITIYGSETPNITVTIHDVASLIKVGTDVVLTGADKFIELIKVDGIWYKGNSNV